MRWIDLNDRQRLYQYVSTRRSEKPNMFAPDASADSYFLPASSGADGCRPVAAIEALTLNSAADFLSALGELWAMADRPDQDLLVRIIAAAALKNAPRPIEGPPPAAGETAVPIREKQADERPEPSTSIFVYEF